MSHVSGAEPSLANTARSRRALPAPMPGKRLILCEDGRAILQCCAHTYTDEVYPGTWLDSDSGSLRGSLDIPSNVTRLERAIKPVARDGIPQVSYYHFGVGAGSGVFNRLQGATGAGLSEIVREGYQYLATNWVPGDEIFIFGFSRGAYTARSIAGLIDEIGMLTREGLPYLPAIYSDVKHKYDPNYVSKNPDAPFPDKPSAANPAYVEELARRRLTRLHVPIKVVGVFETVGALGTPKIGWLSRLGLQSKTQKDLAFHDTALSNCVENAFQALALDERRFAFQPTLWEKMEGNTTVLRQVWFPGAHSNVGGE